MEGFIKMTKQKDIRFPFGKYDGVLIADVPNSYLNWILEQDWFFQKYDEVKYQVVIEMEYRKKFDIVVE